MKKSMFFENAELLAEKFGISPLMYGSLGLEYITGENLNADDIDILIPEIFVTKRWNEFKCIMEEADYVLVDEHEHTFLKNDIYLSYASIEELEPFANINLSEIAEHCDNGVSFKLLSLKQYLQVYHASAKDGYRVNVREKKDNDKIAFIEKYLNATYS